MVEHCSGSTPPAQPCPAWDSMCPHWLSKSLIQKTSTNFGNMRIGFICLYAFCILVLHMLVIKYQGKSGDKDAVATF